MTFCHKCPGSSGVEQWTENPRVGGSNPPPGTTTTIDIMFKKKFLVLLTLLITSSCEAPTTISSRGLDADTEKEKLIMQGIALDTYYKRIEKLNIIVKRNNEDLNFEVLPTKICNHKIILSQDNSLNAFADGKNIYITQGMLRFIEDDKELQMIIAHELAPNIEGHIEKKSNNFILGTLVDLAASSAGINTRGTFGNMGAQMYSQDFEREADYVGMYILANSDINREGVANFWRRMSVENPGSISYASSHPSSSERWVNIEAINKEIDSKITKSLPLIPERIKNN